MLPSNFIPAFIALVSLVVIAIGALWIIWAPYSVTWLRVMCTAVWSFLIGILVFKIKEDE